MEIKILSHMSKPPVLLAIYFIGVGLGWWPFEWWSAIGMGILEIIF